MNIKEQLISLLQDENNPIHWIFIDNKQMSDLAEYLVNNGVTIEETDNVTLERDPFFIETDTECDGCYRLKKMFSRRAVI